MAELAYRDALRDGMAEEMRVNPDVFLMGEEIAEFQGAYKCTQGLLDEFGDKRVIDTPIAELGFAGIATGAAMAGLRPVVEFMTWNFSMMAIDQIVNSAAKTYYMSGGLVGCPIVFRGPNGAAARVAAQHSQDFTPWYMSVPGLKVVSPCNAADAKGLLKAAIRDDAPVCILENEILYGQTWDVPDGDYTTPIGEAQILKSGTDITLIGYSINSIKALEAANQLAQEGISAEVLDLRTVRPMDVAAIVASVSKTHRAVICSESWGICGVAAEVMRIISDHCWDELDAPVRHASGLNVPMPYAKNLEAGVLPQPADIITKAREVLA